MCTCSYETTFDCIGDSGDDELIGGLGNDLLYGDNGKDVLIGGVAHTYRTRSTRGRHWITSLLIEDIVTIVNTTALTPTRLSQQSSSQGNPLNGWPSHQYWLSSHAYLVGSVTAPSQPFNSGYPLDVNIDPLSLKYTHNGSIEVQGMGIRFSPMNLDADIIECGSGDDFALGGRGHDSIRGGPGHDVIVGDLAILTSAVLNSSSTTTPLPNIWYAVRIMNQNVNSNNTGSSSVLNINKEYGSALIPSHIVNHLETTLPLPSIDGFASWDSPTLTWFEQHLPGLVPHIEIVYTPPSTTSHPRPANINGKWKIDVMLMGSFILHSPITSFGNDIIRGNDGNDLIVGKSCDLLDVPLC
jgi:Ca2+-binding RTX toxin-like protein